DEHYENSCKRRYDPYRESAAALFEYHQRSLPAEAGCVILLQFPAIGEKLNPSRNDDGYVTQTIFVTFRHRGINQIQVIRNICLIHCPFLFVHHVIQSKSALLTVLLNCSKEGTIAHLV